MKTNLVKLFLKLAYLLAAKAENARASRLEAIVAKRDKVLKGAIQKKIDLDNQLKDTIARIEKMKTEADENAHNQHVSLNLEYSDLEKV